MEIAHNIKKNKKKPNRVPSQKCICLMYNTVYNC